MSRYIDADLVKVRYRGGFYDDYVVDYDSFMKAPSIDIVRCGECMHNGSYDTDCPFGWRNGEWNMPKPCDFCSYGEREGE